MKRLILSILLLLIISAVCMAQSSEKRIEELKYLIETTDNKAKLQLYYQELSELYEDSQPLKSITYSQESLALLLQLDDDKSKLIGTYIYIAKLHYYAKSPVDSSFKYTQIVEEEIKKIKDTKKQINRYVELAAVYKVLEDNNDKALETNFKALRLSREIGDIQSESKVLNHMGSIFFKENNLKEALKYYKQALALEKKGSINRAYDLLNIGSVYERFGQIDSAYIFYDEASVIFEKTEDVQGEMITLIYSGSYHDYKGEYEEAYQKYVVADRMIKENKAQFLYATIDRAFAKHYFLTKKYQKSIDYGVKALKVFKKEKNEYTIKDLYEILSESYAEMGNFSKAYGLQKEYIIFKDSIETFELSTKIDALEAKLTTVEKEKENELLKAEQKNYRKAIQSRNATAIALLLGLLLIGSWGLLLYRNNRQKQELNEQLESTVMERTTALRQANKDLKQANYELRTFNYIASHDIKEPIRNIGSYVGLIRRKLPTEMKESLGDYFNTIKRSTSQLYTLIEDFALYTTMSKNEVIEKEEVDLNQLTNSVVDNLKESIERYKGQVVISNLPSIQSRNSLLFTTLKNLIENGLKYNDSDRPTVNIDYNKIDTTEVSGKGYHEIIISDNGIGIDQEYYERIFEMFKRLHHRGEYEGSGIGLAIVKLSVDKLGGTIELESEEGKGSQFILKLPL